jgi:hypothetical protein
VTETSTGIERSGERYRTSSCRPGGAVLSTWRSSFETVLSSRLLTGATGDRTATGSWSAMPEKYEEFEERRARGSPA